MNIYIDWVIMEYRITYNFPNGSTSSVGYDYTQELDLPSYDVSTNNPGYDFVGWFTEPNGGGQQISAGTKYSDIEPSDLIENRELYAYIVPSVGGSSVSTMSVLDEVVSSIQAASEPAPVSSAAPATRSLSTAAIATIGASTGTISTSHLLSVANDAASMSEMSTGSTTGTMAQTVIPMQAVLPTGTRRA